MITLFEVLLFSCKEAANSVGFATGATFKERKREQKPPGVLSDTGADYLVRYTVQHRSPTLYYGSVSSPWLLSVSPGLHFYKE